MLITCGFGDVKSNCLVHSKHSQARINKGFRDKSVERYPDSKGITPEKAINAVKTSFKC